MTENTLSTGIKSYEIAYSMSLSTDGFRFALGDPTYHNSSGIVRVFDLTTSPPTFPNAVNATDGDFEDRIQVTWSDVAGETSYQIYRCGSSSIDSCTTAIATLPADEDSYEDSSAETIGSLYYYRL